MARPTPVKDDSRRATVAVLAVGAFVVLGLALAGAMVLMREPPMSTAPHAAAATPVATASAEPSRLEPSNLLVEARRQASAWQHDAALIRLSASPLDAHGVAPGGKVELTFAKPSGQRISGGAEASGQHLVLKSSDGPLTKSEERAGKGSIAPEPNCPFENAWSAAQHAGADTNAGLGMRYQWSDKQGRPVWEVVSGDGQVLRRLDGVNCTILTR